VARDAGDEGATYPKSVHCRQFLFAVLDICHQVVMTPCIKEEWDKHQSKFAPTWRRQMVAKKKWNYLTISINDSLWTPVEKIAGSLSNTRIEEIIKDLCLLEAGMTTDKIVISVDDNTTIKFFSEASFKIDELRNIAWVNLDKKFEGEQPIEFLTNGAEAENSC
jgi:hypothetical protein